jgi:hypothetical protein
MRETMTRKDYVLIAKAFATFNYLNQPTRYFIAHALADALEGDNPRFDRERFLKSCDLWDGGRVSKAVQLSEHDTEWARRNKAFNGR